MPDTTTPPIDFRAQLDALKNQLATAHASWTICPRCHQKMDGFCDPCHDRDRFDDSRDGEDNNKECDDGTD